jgi:hypothetical protein
MKNTLIFMVVLAFVTVQAFSQKNPAEIVKKEFDKKYATAQSVKWNQEEKNEWEAEFIIGDKKMSASFDNTGKWLESETEITEKELPAPVTVTLNKDFLGYKRGDISILDSPQMKGYEIGLKKGKTSIEVVIDSNGNILKKIVE